MKKVLFLMVISAVLSGCAAPKNWGAAGGSKADGTVKLAYTYGMFEVPKVDSEQGLKVATNRCVSWGYEKAIAFDFVDTECKQMSSSGCSKTMVSQEYQCE